MLAYSYFTGCLFALMHLTIILASNNTTQTSLTLNNGYQMPQLGLGTWQSKPGEVGEAVRTALEVGYRNFDCAMVYLNQEEIGKVFNDTFKNGKIKREEVFVTSKIWNIYHSHENATKAVDIILKDLQLQYLDMLLIHTPMGYFEGGEFMPMKDGKPIISSVDYLDTWRAMEEAVKAGKVRSIGLSNFNISQMERVLNASTIKPQTNQVEVHPYFPQDELLAWCKKQNIVVTAYSPLGSNSHVWRKQGDPNLLEEKILMEIAQNHNKTSAQVAIRWAIQRGTVAIPKSVKRSRLEENIDVFDFELTSGEMDNIKKLDRKWRIAHFEMDKGHPYFPF